MRLRRDDVAKTSGDAAASRPPNAERLRELLKFDGGIVGHGDHSICPPRGVAEKAKRPSGNSGRASLTDELFRLMRRDRHRRTDRHAWQSGTSATIRKKPVEALKSRNIINATRRRVNPRDKSSERSTMARSITAPGASAAQPRACLSRATAGWKALARPRFQW